MLRMREAKAKMQKPKSRGTGKAEDAKAEEKLLKTIPLQTQFIQQEFYSSFRFKLEFDVGSYIIWNFERNSLPNTQLHLDR